MSGAEAGPGTGADTDNSVTSPAAAGASTTTGAGATSGRTNGVGATPTAANLLGGASTLVTNGTSSSIVTTGVSNDGSSGFGAVNQACQELVSSAERQMGITKPTDSSSGLQFEYSLAFQLFARLHTNWTVVNRFTLRSITLRLEAQFASDTSPAFRIMLSAEGEIGDLKFSVSAEIPHLKKDVPLKIEFILNLRSQTKPDDLWKGVQSISGGDSGTMPSSMVDSSLKDVMDMPLFEANLALGFVKPVGGSFSFSHCLFRFGGQINYVPKIDFPKLKIVNGSFSFALIKEQKKVGDAQYQAFAELAGRVIVARTLLSVAVTFTRVNQTITVRLRVWNAPPMAASDYERISPDKFYRSVLAGDTGASPGANVDLVSKLIALPSSPSLDVLRYDLTVPSVRFALMLEIGSQGLNELLFQVYARDICAIQADFLKGCAIRNLILNVNLNPRDKNRLCLISGTLEIDLWRFQAALQYEQHENKSLIQIKASLERATAGNCSIVTLAKDAIFNSDAKDNAGTQENSDVSSSQPPNSSGLDKYVDNYSVPAESGLSLNLAKQSNLSADVYFEMALSKNVSSAGNGTAQPGAGANSSSADSGQVQDITDKTTAEEGKFELSGYQLEMAKFRAHFGLSWTAIPDHVVLEKMGLAFDIFKPTTPKKKIAGYIYGEWTIEKFVLWTYILGEQNASGSSIIIGLNIKSKRDGQVGDTLASVLADPKLANSVGMPELELHPDVKASPQTQKLASGLNLDGHLRIRLLKQAPTDPSQQAKWKLKEIMAHLDLEADFTLFGNKSLASAYIDVRIRDPLEQNKQIECCLVGYLKSGNLDILIASLIKVKTGQPPVTDDASDQAKAIKAAKSDVSVKKPPKPAEDKEDLRFRAMIRYVQGESKETKVNDVLNELSSGNAVTSDDNKFIPPDLNISAEKFASSLDFYFDLHVGKKQGESSRNIKSMIFTVAAKGQWDIIDNILAVKDAGLRLMILEAQGDQPKRKVFIAYGTISLFDATAFVPVALFYENGILSFGAVVVISLTKLLNGFSGSNVNDVSETSSNTPSILTEKQTAPSGIIASVICTVKNKKFDSFDIKIRSVGVISITDKFSIDQIIINYSKAAVAKDKALGLSGNLNWGIAPNQNSLTITATFTQKLITLEFALNKAPGKMLDDILGADAPSKDSRPALPDVTGFSNYNDTYTPPSDKTRAFGRLLFEQQENSTSRSFQSAAFILKAASDWKWNLIDKWIWFTSLEFSLIYIVPKKELALQLAVTLNYMRRDSSGGNPTPDTVQITLKATKKQLRLEFPSSKLEGCDSTDVIYCLSAGFFDVSRKLGIPMFPRVVVILSWEDELASIEGHLTKEGENWEFNKMLGSILRMENPMLAGTIPFGKSKQKARASIKGTAVLISTIRVEIEYVLPDGPLYVAGLDIRKIKELIEDLWKLAKKLYDLGTKIFEIGEAIGSFIASAALAAEGIIDGLIVIGGALLAGAAWEAFKKEMIDAFKSLFDTDEKKKEAEDGIRQGAKKHEKEETAKTDPDKHDDPKKPVSPETRDPNDPNARTTAKEGLDISGTGSASGICDEAVQLVVVPLGTGAQSSTSEPELYTVTFYYGDSPRFSRDVYVGGSVRWAYRRPKTEQDYTIKIVAKGAGPTELVKELQLCTRSTRSACISEPKSNLLLPPNITAGVPFSSTLVLRDIKNNLIDGYDDRKLLVMNIDSDIHPKVLLRRNAYVLNFPALKRGQHTFVAIVDGRQIGQFSLNVVAKLNPASVSLRGLGLSSGLMGDPAPISIKCFDHNGDILENAAISIIMTSAGFQTAITCQYNAEKGVYTATYTRPNNYGKYQLAIAINGQPVGGSPLTLMAHDYVDISRTQISVVDTRPTRKTQTAVIEIYDYVGSRWRLSSNTFADAQLVCEDGTRGPPTLYNLLVDNEDGSYHVEVQLQRTQEYRFSLKLPDGRISPAIAVTVPDQTLAKTFYASGDGLQTGYEGTTAVIDLFAFNEAGNAAVLKQSKITAFITQMDTSGSGTPVEFKIQDSKIYYVRPKSRNTSDSDTKQADAVDIYVRIFYGPLEAYGSPFHTLSAPYFADVRPDHYEIVQVPNGQYSASLPTKTVSFILIDSFNCMMTEEAKLTIKKVNNGTFVKYTFLPSGMYAVEYTSNDDSVTFDVVLQGKKLPQTEKTSTTTFSLSSPAQEGFSDPLKVAYKSSGPLILTDSNFKCLVFPTCVNEPGDRPEYFEMAKRDVDSTSNTVTFTGVANLQSLASLHSKWYTVAAKYKYLPLESTSGSLDVRRSLPGASVDPPSAIILSSQDLDNPEDEDQPPKKDNTGRTLSARDQIPDNFNPPAGGTNTGTPVRDRVPDNFNPPTIITEAPTGSGGGSSGTSIRDRVPDNFNPPPSEATKTGGGSTAQSGQSSVRDRIPDNFLPTSPSATPGAGSSPANISQTAESTGVTSVSPSNPARSAVPSNSSAPPTTSPEPTPSPVVIQSNAPTADSSQPPGPAVP